ncbi:MAG: hypothetical protein ACFFDI_23345 [Promethearchaeota archaeon]
MSELIRFYHSKMVNALYYFEYHGPLKKKMSWIEQDPSVRELYSVIKKIKFPRFKYFLSWAKHFSVIHDLDSPKKLTRFTSENPPRGKLGENWLAELEKMDDILQEILNVYKDKVLTPERKANFEKYCAEIKKKYSPLWLRLKEESEKLPGISWKKKNPIICLLDPIDGRLTYKSSFGDIAFVEVSKTLLEEEDRLFHEVIKLLNFTRPLGRWVKQDREGIRAISYELFTEMQSLKIQKAVLGKHPNFRSVIRKKLDTMWIPMIRPETMFDEEELERILNNAYKMIPKHEFDSLYQLGELNTELNIILLN